MPTPDPLPPEVRKALEQGNLLEAIKQLRKTGLGLKAAKDAIDQIDQRLNQAASRPGKPVPPPMKPAPPTQLSRTGLSPGEVPRSRDGVLLLVGIASLLAWWFLR